MKTLYIYSDKTGLKRSENRNNKIISKLRTIYNDLTVQKTSTLEEVKNLILSCKNTYKTLIIAGGDGTLKYAVNVLMCMKKEDRPVLGYLPCGTVNDAGKAFGCGNTVSSGLRNLKRNQITNIDLVKVNDHYINFVVAIGAYSDISYIAKRDDKKHFGKIAYYFTAIPQIFKKKMVNARIEADGVIYNVKTPFIMMLNSRNVGGFPVNFGYSIKDGLVDLYVTEPGIFNGLLHYVFFKMKTLHVRAKNIAISTDQEQSWCYDGEEGEKGDIKVEVLKEELTVIGKAK